MSGFAQLLPEGSISELSGDFTPLVSVLEVVTKKVSCVLRRGTRLRERGPGTSSRPLPSGFRTGAEWSGAPLARCALTAPGSAASEAHPQSGNI